MAKYNYTEMTIEIHEEERRIIKRLLDDINNIDMDKARYTDIIRIRGKIRDAAHDLKELNHFWYVLCYLENEEWTIEELIEHAKRINIC